ncbi:basic phospholipase A2 homolog BnuTX-I-like [Centruroides vittatus]|uniref:basic phospholipase A2 homolog BnuTX-I-like n=1 Tax=Centruroides vittatus TaxID=120091 RepID=UPI0035106009
MKALSIFLLFATLYAIQCAPSRHKRSLFAMWHMVKNETGKYPGEFLPYGKYCGLGGEGKPVDRIDKCCKTHDECYTSAYTNECKHDPGQVYVVKYKWYKKKKGVRCGKNPNPCAAKVCDCDQKLVVCFHRFMDEYNPKYHHRLYLSFLPQFKSALKTHSLKSLLEAGI